jgi:hypothetical protein
MQSPYLWFATFAFILLLLGFSVRHSRRDLHVGLMCGGMGLDLIIVILLEFGRDAVATAIGPGLTPFQQLHVASSTLAVLFYLPVFGLGMARWRNPDSSPALKRWHKRLGYCALACRTVGFLFMFSIVGKS